MNEDDKKLYELAKKELNINSLEQLALYLGYAGKTSNNWYKSGFNDKVRYKILEAINKTSKNTSMTNDNEIGKSINSFEFEKELLEDIPKLTPKQQEYYYHRVKADLIENENIKQ